MPQGLLTFIIIISIAAVIAIVAFIIYRILMPKLKEEKPSDEDILNEEMTRILQPIDDPETAKEVTYRSRRHIRRFLHKKRRVIYNNKKEILRRI